MNCFTIKGGTKTESKDCWLNDIKDVSHLVRGATGEIPVGGSCQLS